MSVRSEQPEPDRHHDERSALTIRSAFDPSRWQRPLHGWPATVLPSDEERRVARRLRDLKYRLALAAMPAGDD
jgi:hypothetical protein